MVVLVSLERKPTKLVAVVGQWRVLQRMKLIKRRIGRGAEHGNERSNLVLGWCDRAEVWAGDNTSRMANPLLFHLADELQMVTDCT